MKVIIDKNIPYIKGVLEPYAEVCYLPYDRIDAGTVRDADALIVRTRTICDRRLLDGSRVRFIASATIGFDHIDLDYCRSHDIEAINAPGCNCNAVAEYVATALHVLSRTKGFELAGKTVGIVGAGHVGMQVMRLCRQMGLAVLASDPPREAAEALDPEVFVPLDELLRRSDIVTIHIPLCVKNEKFIDSNFLGKMKYNSIFVNSSRGEVVDDVALKAARGKLSALVLDVWNHEPQIDKELVNMADIATPHIAGYSVEGKINGTIAAVRGFGRHFGIDSLNTFTIAYDKPAFNLDSYDIMSDDKALRADPSSFEHLRSVYKYR